MKNKRRNSKDFLVQGTILAAASIIAKIIGMVYRLPLYNILGPLGSSYYSTANEIYTIILMVSSFSLPLAVSKLVSERLNRGEARNAHRIFLCAVKFGLVSGGSLALLTWLCSGLITKYVMSFELAKYGLQVLAPAIFICAIVGAFRGYFQGHSTMIPTAVSQVIEQIVNALVSLLCAYIMFSYGTQLGAEQGNADLGPAWGAAGATFGTVVSLTVALLFMMFVYNSYKRVFVRQARRDVSTRKESEWTIYRSLILTILPIVLSTVVYNITTVLDQGIFNSALRGIGYTDSQYGTIWGIYTGEFRVIMNVPLSLASCLAPSVVPALTAALNAGDNEEIHRKIQSSIRYTMIITIPCAVGLAVLASPILGMLFHDDLSLSTGIMQSGALMIIFFAFSTLTTGILQGLGELKKPLIHTCIALVIHVGALLFLLHGLNLNIYAVIYANTLFAFIICVLNAWSIKKAISYRQEVLRSFLIPTLSSLVMGVAVAAVYRLLHILFGVSVSAILAILVGVLVYFAALIKFHGITEEEIYHAPKGAKLMKLCRKLRLVR